MVREGWAWATRYGPHRIRNASLALVTLAAFAAAASAGPAASTTTDGCAAIGRARELRTALRLNDEPRRLMLANLPRERRQLCGTSR